ncbi:hypothetical protein LTR08_002206 [Meristemomyces frigidus]|nr:hypothetical protein LTR08_002206 [Meristemomyces frigidus]
MEKLILRSIMYGADKIPDTWFDRVPGGYYKKKEQQAQAAVQDAKDKRDSKGRYGSGGSGGRTNDVARSRRRSTGEGGRRPREDLYNDRGRGDSGGQRRGQRDRDSYDGGDDGYHSSNDDKYRRRARSGRRQNFDSQDDRYETNDGYREDHSRVHHRPPYPQADFVPPQSPPAAPYAVPDAASGMTAVPSRAPYPSINHVSSAQHFPQSTAAATNSRPAEISTGYIPYAYLYGQQQQQPAQPRQASSGSHSNPSSNNSMPPINIPVAPPHGYRQNVYAQQFPTAAAAGAGAAYTGFAGPYLNGEGYDPRFDRGREEREFYARNVASDDRHRVRSERRMGDFEEPRRGKSTGGQAREKHRPQDQPSSPMIDPRMPLNSQLRRDKTMPQRRKDDHRNSKYYAEQDDRGEPWRNGHYSD